MSLRVTPSQTVGPFFEIGLASLYSADMAGPSVRGTRVVLGGRVLDGDGAPIPDALLEFWQADADGRYPARDLPLAAAAPPEFSGFGRVATDAEGRFSVKTIQPGPVDEQAPHLCVQIFMRGLLKPVHSRIYFPDDPKLGHDPLLALVPSARRSTLIARHAGENVLEWDVHMQGEGETVFFEF